jgi:Skp family chaperone for outer membrane proteins
MNKILPAAAGLLAVVSVATAAAAQAPAAAPAQTPLQATGAPTPGMCFLSADEMLMKSSVGQSVNVRLQQLQQAVNAELSPEANALRAGANNQTEEWKKRAGALQTKSAIREQELEATAAEQRNKILAEARPLIQAALQERSCAAVLDKASTYAVNPSMDVTDLVVSKLNTKLATLTFDRVNLEQKYMAQAAANAPRPAVAAKPAAKPAAKK